MVDGVGEGGIDVTTKAVTLEPRAQLAARRQAATALVVHANPDDDKTDPTGNSGGRIACGVITK